MLKVEPKQSILTLYRNRRVRVQRAAPRNIQKLKRKAGKRGERMRRLSLKPRRERSCYFKRENKRKKKKSHGTVKDKRRAVSCGPELVNCARLAVKSVGKHVLLRLLGVKCSFPSRRRAFSCSASTDEGGFGCCGAWSVAPAPISASLRR